MFFGGVLQSRPLDQLGRDFRRREDPVFAFRKGSAAVPQHRWLKFSVLVVAVASLAPLGIDGYKDLRDRLVPKKLGVVEVGKIYRSGQLHRALVRETLAKNHIQVVIDLTHDDPSNMNQRAEQAAIRDLGLQGLRFPMNGNGTGEIEQVAGAVAALAKAEHEGKPVLVHCAAGAQRTGCVIATYRLLVKGDSPSDVLTEMEQYGWRPDHDQVMLNFLNDHLPDFANRLVDLGTLSERPRAIPSLTGSSKSSNPPKVATATDKIVK